MTDGPYRPREDSQTERIWHSITETPGLGYQDLFDAESHAGHNNRLLARLEERGLIRVEYDERGWRRFYPPKPPPELPF